MYKRVPLVVLLVAPLLLSGCSSTASGTPFFSAGEGVIATPTSEATGDSVTNSNAPSNTTGSSKETKPSESTSTPKPSTAPKGVEEHTKKFAKKYGLKINEDGIPYSDNGNVEITEGPEYESVKKYNEERTEESVKNDFIASPDLIASLAGIYNSYYQALMDKDWKKACSYVNLTDSSEKKCISSLKANDGNYKKGLKKLHGDTVKSLVFDNKNITLTLGLEREENQSAKFRKTDKGWKITINI